VSYAAQIAVLYRRSETMIYFMYMKIFGYRVTVGIIPYFIIYSVLFCRHKIRCIQTWVCV